MRILEIKISALNPTNQTLFVPSNSTIGYGIQVDGGFNVQCYKEDKICEIEGYLDDRNLQPYYIYNSGNVGTSEEFTICYCIRKDNEIFTIECPLVLEAVDSGITYRSSSVSKDIDEKVATVDNKVNRLGVRTMNLENEMSTLDTDINTKLDDIKTDTSKISEMSGQMTTVTKEMATVSQEMTETVNAIGVIPERFDTMNAKLDNNYISKAIYDELNSSIKTQLDEI